MEGQWRAQKQARLRRAVEQVERQVEEDFIQERAEAARNFYNAVTDVIKEQQPSIETQLYVYELIRFELMAQRSKELFQPAVAHTHDSNGSLAVGIS